ncbi:MAG: hypothetical protein AVDCRST_MAG38-707, partial [uncultured Solirubrobacteraceae bacterium]
WPTSTTPAEGDARRPTACSKRSPTRLARSTGCRRRSPRAGPPGRAPASSSRTPAVTSPTRCSGPGWTPTTVSPSSSRPTSAASASAPRRCAPTSPPPSCCCSSCSRSSAIRARTA